MTNRLILKRSSTANSAPTDGDLEYGELAINYADGTLYFKNSSNTIQVLASTNSLTLTGNLSANNVVATELVSANIVATNTLRSDDDTFVYVDDGMSIAQGLSVVGNIDSGNISATGIIGTLLTNAQPNVTSVGNLTDLVVTGNITVDSVFGNSDNVEISAGGFISTFDNTGNVDLPGNLSITNSALVGGVLTVSANADVSGNLSVTGNITAGNVSGTLLTGTLETAAQPNVTSVGTLSTLTVTGNVAAGNVSGTLLTGTLETAAQPNITSVGTLSTLTVTGNVSAGNVSGTLLTGTLETAAQPNVTSLGNLVDLSVDGNIVAGGNVDVIGSLNAATLVGTATNVTLVAGSYTATFNNLGNLLGPGNVVATNAVSAGTTVSAVGNISGGNVTTVGVITATGNVTGNYFLGNGRFLDGISSQAIFNGNSTVSIPTQDGNILGNVDGNTIAEISANGLIVTGTIEATGGFVGISTDQISNGTSQVVIPVANGNVTTNVASSTIIVAHSGGAEFTGDVDITGNVDALGTITGNYFSGDGGGLSNISSAGTSISNGTSRVEVVESGGNIIANVNDVTIMTVSFDGVEVTDLDAGNVDVIGNVSADYLIATTGIVGNLVTADQPNITSLGQLTSLSVAGNATVQGNLTVSGNTVYVNITELNVQDPIIGLGRGANNTPLSSDDGKDRGEQLWYYDTQEKSAFIGFDNSESKMLAAVNVSIINETVTVDNYGNFVVGNLESATVSATGLISTTGNVSANYFLGDGGLLGNITVSGGTEIVNGNSNVAINVANGNVTISVSGEANTVTITEDTMLLKGTYANPKNITESVVLNTGWNNMLIGPITVDDIANVTVPDGAMLSIL